MRTGLHTALALGLAAALAACGGAPPSPAGAGADAEQPAPGDFRTAEALEHARQLTEEVGVRRAGSTAETRAAADLGDRLAALGYEVSLQRFVLSRNEATSLNVVARPAGLDPRRDRHLLLGGHFDTVESPGADDNASGIGCILEIARALGERPAPLPVVFVLFGAEELQPPPSFPAPGESEPRSLQGSRHFVAELAPEQAERLVAVFILDAVGRGSEVLVGRVVATPASASLRLLHRAQELDIPAREVYTPFESDHVPFLRAGIPAAWLWGGNTELTHTPGDTFDRLQPEALERAGRLALATLHSYE